MTDDVGMGAGLEFDAIRSLLAQWGPLATGIGDDAAVIHPARGDALVISVDTAVEGRHFRADWLSPREIGYRAVAAALSDLAAMAARPTGILVALSVPAAWRDKLTALADGVGEAAALAQTHILGGNISDAGELSITTTVLGEAFAPVSRSGARPGDRVYVTGRLGAPSAALALLLQRGDAGAYRERFARPVPRLAEARWLAARGVRAMIDVSDGLVADLGHVAVASGVCIELDARRIPCVDGVDAAKALASGEEYELALAVNGALDTGEFTGRFGIPLTEVGRVTIAARAGESNVHVRGAVAASRGYDHFSG